MSIPGNLLTTAMAVMPHKDVDRALEVGLSMDVPFWPQLPLYSYYEDMYVQASEHFPGILLDMEKRTLRFSMEKFISEFEEAMAHFDEPEYFDISNTYSAVYNRFLELDLSVLRSNGESFVSDRAQMMWISVWEGVDDPETITEISIVLYSILR